MAGCALAYRLVAAGVRVTLLDQGPEIYPTDRPLFANEWEFSLGREWAFDPNVRGLPEDYPVLATGFAPYMYNGVGGSTNHYGGFWHRLKPVDFRKGSEHGLEGTLDWPLTYEELEPYYDLNDRFIGISGYPGDPSYPPRDTPRCPPLPHGPYYKTLADGFDALGWHWWPGDNAIISVPYNHRLPCNLCGHCNAGCPREAIGTASVAYARPALALGLDLRPLARAIRVTTDRRGRADGVDYVDLRTGEMHRVEAPVVVIAANAIGTPRLLLNSASSQHPEGLANENGLVGRHLMLHGWLIADFWLDEPTEHYKGPATATFYCHEFYDTDISRGFLNGFAITISAAFGPALVALGGATGQSPVAWGVDHHRAFERSFNHHCYVNVQTDDLPVATNRVTLDLEVKDPSGMPAARVEYALHENDRRALEYAAQRVAELADAVRAKHVTPQPIDERYRAPGWHLMGTCRIGTSPDQSVTDEWHRAWHVPGLVICDGSSMVTGGAANPAATIGALALRCADKLAKGKGRKVGARAPEASPGRVRPDTRRTPQKARSSG
jgi:choline dehydrogenase-like flavoprotein